MKHRHLYLLMLLSSLSMGSAMAESAYRVGDLNIESPWARATPSGAMAGAAFLQIHNEGSADDRLLAVESDVANTVELHKTEFVDSVMKMRKQEGIDLPAGQSVSLEPGGFHIMFIGLHDGLAEGTTIELTLRFERAGALDLEVPVKSLTAGAAGQHGGQMSHGDSTHKQP